MGKTGAAGTPTVPEVAKAVGELELTPGKGSIMTDIAARLQIRKRSGRKAKDWFAAHHRHFSMEDLGSGKFRIRNAPPDKDQRERKDKVEDGAGRQARKASVPTGGSRAPLPRAPLPRAPLPRVAAAEAATKRSPAASRPSSPAGSDAET